MDRQSTETREEGASERVSDINLNVGSVEQLVCVPESVIDESDKSEVQERDEGIPELRGTQTGGFKENMTDKIDEMSQCIDDGSRDEEQWSDTSDIASLVENDICTLEQTSHFLDETKGKAGVVSDFFPDLEKFIASVIWARKTVNYEELSQQKTFQLKKHMMAIRQGK